MSKDSTSIKRRLLSCGLLLAAVVACVPVSPKTSFTDNDYPVLLDELTGELAKLRDRLTSDPEGIALHDTVAGMLESFLARAESEVGLCAVPVGASLTGLSSAEIDQKHADCWRDNLAVLSDRAYNDKFIERVSEFHLKTSAEMIAFKDGKLALKANPLEKKADFRKLQSFAAYLRSRNGFLKARMDGGLNGDLEYKVMEQLRNTFKRELPLIGKVTIDEYVLATYSSFQVKEMGGLFFDAAEVMTASRGETVAFMDDPTAMDKQIAQDKAQIGTLIDQACALTNDPAKQTECLSEVKQEYKKLGDDEKSAQSNERHFELGNGDLYRFAYNWLRVRVQEESSKSTGMFYHYPAPMGADLVTAAYLSNRIDAQTLLAIADMPELHESYRGFWAKAGQFGLSITKVLAPIVSVYGAYVTLGFVIYDSLHGMDNYAKQEADKSYLVR